jgi:RNA polymerase sigma-70 factor (ECF subfamily)
MASNGITDEVLQAARLGSDWAWTAVYRELSPAVLRYIRSNGGGAHSEDVLGEVFVQVVRKYSGFSGSPEDFRSWVFVIAHNKLVDHWRRRASDRSTPTDEAAFATIDAEEHVEDEALRHLGEADVRRILDRLPPDQRSVLLLRFIADLSIADTARALGKRQGAVKSLQRRALDAIRREISRGAVSP